MSSIQKYKKELLKVVLYYFVGSLICYLVYTFIPHTYIHAPAVHHILIFLMFVVSFVIGITCLIISYTQKEKRHYQWLGIFYLVPSLLFIIWLILGVSSY